MQRFLAAALTGLTLLGSSVTAQQRLAAPMTPAALRSRLETYTADSMRGRLTGSEDHRRATRYIAEELRRAGLRPAGDNGSFLQRVPLFVTTLDTANSVLSAAGSTLQPYRDYLPRYQGPRSRSMDGVALVYAGIWGSSTLLRGIDVRGKVVLVSTPTENASVVKVQAQNRFAESAGIVLANFELMEPALRQGLASSPMQLDGPEATGQELPAYVHISRATAARLLGLGNLDDAQPGREGSALRGSPRFKKVSVESYNVVAILPGSDPRLRDEYVAVGAHSDHVGTSDPVDRDSLRAFQLELRRKQLTASGSAPSIEASIRVNMDSIRRVHPKPRLDSIYNGADDDGSGSMAVLELARAMATERNRPKRSMLFVWHTGEELGLFGSEYYTDNPTVPREQIVAQINIDMIGRGGRGEEVNGGPNYLQLIGSRRLSTQLGDVVEEVSRSRRYNWAFDYQYDAIGHPEQFYCRSDHYSYARYGIPVVFMTTGGHADYHQVTDEVEFLDFRKLSRVTHFAHDLARALGDRQERPLVDKPRPNPRGNCVQ